MALSYVKIGWYNIDALITLPLKQRTWLVHERTFLGNFFLDYKKELNKFSFNIPHVFLPTKVRKDWSFGESVFHKIATTVKSTRRDSEFFEVGRLPKQRYWKVDGFLSVFVHKMGRRLVLYHSFVPLLNLFWDIPPERKTLQTRPHTVKTQQKVVSLFRDFLEGFPPSTYQIVFKMP